MENALTIGSSFGVSPALFTTTITGNTFEASGVKGLQSMVGIGSIFYITTSDNGDANSSYKTVRYLYVGRTGR